MVYAVMHEAYNWLTATIADRKFDNQCMAEPVWASSVLTSEYARFTAGNLSLSFVVCLGNTDIPPGGINTLGQGIPCWCLQYARE
jgi:hypothetical protein